MFGLNLTILASALAGVAGFGLAWQLRAGTIESMKLEAANERIAIQRAARTAIDRAAVQITRAQTESATRAVALRADADAARGELDGLRGATADAVRTASANLEACTGQASALGVVFDQCTRQLQAVAADADEWSNQAVTLQNAWPK